MIAVDELSGWEKLVAGISTAIVVAGGIIVRLMARESESDSVKTEVRTLIARVDVFIEDSDARWEQQQRVNQRLETRIDTLYREGRG